MIIKKLLPLLLLITCVCAGCAIAFEDEDIPLQPRVYNGATGYTVDVPADWSEEELDQDTVRFCDEDGQIALNIVSELGGMDYFSMREIKEQIIEKIGGDIFATYDITLDEGGTKFFRVTLIGADKDGSRVVADIYAQQPFVTTRHYLVLIASAAAYEEYHTAVDDIFASFTATFTEDEYLQLMEERREAAAAAKAEREAAALQEAEPEGEDSGEQGESAE